MTAEQKSREAVMINNLRAIYPDIEALYTDLHEHPELLMQEVQTSAKVASRLNDAGFEVTSGVGGTGANSARGSWVMHDFDESGSDAFQSLQLGPA